MILQLGSQKILKPGRNLGTVLPLLHMAFFFAKSDEPLLSFEAIQSALQSHSYAFRGVQDIDLSAVVGSEGRPHEFARSFVPGPQHLQRLQQLSEAGPHIHQLPIEVFQVDQVYFIRDGHHRVALARTRGQKHIKALVTEVVARASITAQLPSEEILKRAHKSHFFELTNLDRHAPDTDFSLHPPELYTSLLNHIEVHRYYLGQQYQRDFSLLESAASWHDLVYVPLQQVLESSGLRREFPKRSPAELYLWLTYHREQWRCRGEYENDAAVASALLERFSERPGHSLLKRVQRVWQAAWKAAQESPEPPPS